MIDYHVAQEAGLLHGRYIMLAEEKLLVFIVPWSLSKTNIQYLRYNFLQICNVPHIRRTPCVIWIRDPGTTYA